MMKMSWININRGKKIYVLAFTLTLVVTITMFHSLHFVPKPSKYDIKHTSHEKELLTEHGVWNQSALNKKCSIPVSENMDLLKQPKLQFDSRVKNPCWHHNGQMRCLPYVILIGSAKCGTVDLYRRICSHPEFIQPMRKEPNWLSNGRFHKNTSIEDYAEKYFGGVTLLLQDNVTANSNYITGDFSINNQEGSHYWHLLGRNIGKDGPIDNNPQYIHHINPDVRILMNLRNPIDRLWSEYLALSRSPNKSAESFHFIVERAIKAYKQCSQSRTLRSCMYDRQLCFYSMMTDQERMFDDECSLKYNPSNCVRLRRGVYHVFLQDYIQVFPTDHILVQRLEDIATHQEKSLIQTYEFLDMRPLNVTKIAEILRPPVFNVNGKVKSQVGQMFNKTRRLLFDFYKPHNEALAKLMNESRFDYGIH